METTRNSSATAARSSLAGSRRPGVTRRPRTLSVGLLGCGNAGERHAAALGAGGLDLDLRAAFDPDSARLLAFSARHGAEPASSLDALLRQRLDVVIVCAPNQAHTSLARAALESGSHVVLEHPLAATAAAADRLCRLAQRRSRRLFVVRQRRYSGLVQALRGALADAALGRIRRVSAELLWSRDDEYFRSSAWRREPGAGGVMTNQASHFLDLVLYLFGDATSITGVRGNLRHRYPVEDTALGTVRFDSGVEADFLFSVACRDGCRQSELGVEGDDGEVRLGGAGWERLLAWSAPNPPPETVAASGHREFLARVSARLNGKVVEVLEAAGSLASVRAIEAFYAHSQNDTALTLALLREQYPHRSSLLAPLAAKG